MQSKIYTFTVIFQPAEEGGYNVSVPSLPGCFTQGKTLEEAKTMAKDAIEAYCQSLIKDGESIPEEKVYEGEFVGHISCQFQPA